MSLSFVPRFAQTHSAHSEVMKEEKEADSRSIFKSDLEVLSDSFSFAFDFKERLRVLQVQGRETERTQHENNSGSGGDGGACLCEVEDLCQEHFRRAYERASCLHGEMRALQLMSTSVTAFLLCLKHKLDPTHVPRDVVSHIVNLAKKKRGFAATI